MWNKGRNDLLSQLKKDIFSISIGVALSGVVIGIFTIGNHYQSFDNDIDYRELLSVLIGVLTTIVVTTYSLTVVALQLASVQFSPRILRWFFTDDRFNQWVLGGFIATISYLILLKSFAPKTLDIFLIFGLTMALILICVIFPLFIAHIADSINAGSITRRIAFNLLDEIDNMYGKEAKIGIYDKPINIEKPKQKVLLFACENGYIKFIDYKQFETIFAYVKKAAAIQNIKITAMYQLLQVGEFLGEDLPIFSFAFEGNTDIAKQMELSLKKDIRLHKMITQCVKSGKYRNYSQDINFGIRQLVDIGIKAISPAINDPTTCINCLDYLGVVLRKLVHCPVRCLTTQQFPPYIHGKEFGFKEFTDHAFDQIYHFGQTDFIIVCRVLRILRSIAEAAHNQYNIDVLYREFDDIRKDVLDLHTHFTTEAFAKIKLEIEACENCFTQKKLTF